MLNTLKRHFKESLSSYSEIASIILFGSYAKKTYTEESDIDLCVLFKKGVSEAYEEEIFNIFLDLEKKLDKTVQGVFIPVSDLERWDRILLEDIVAEGVLLYGSEDYKSLLITHLELEPFYIITLNLKNLVKSDKMKLKRYLYGYKTKKQYQDKQYAYQKKGKLQKLKGSKLGRGSFLIPEKQFHIIKEEFRKYNLHYAVKRCWMQRV